MPLAASNDLKTEKNKTQQESAWLKLFKTKGPPRTNLIYPSEDFTGWITSNASVTANQTVAPDSQTTGDKVTISSINGYISKTYVDADPRGKSYTFSIFAKAGTIDPNFHSFDLKIYRGTNLETVRLYGDEIAWIPCYNGWLRGSVGVTFSDPTAGANVILVVSSAVVGNFYLWGVMLEALASLSFYLPTVDVGRTSTDLHLVDFNRYISFDDECYSPFPLRLGNLTAAVNGEIPTVGGIISNTGRYLTDYLRQNVGMIDKTVTITWVNRAFLSDPALTAFSEVFEIQEEMEDSDTETVSFVLGITKGQNIEGPVGNYDRSFCPSIPSITPRITTGIGVM
jgi:hypothetical protein